MAGAQGRRASRFSGLFTRVCRASQNRQGVSNRHVLVGAGDYLRRRSGLETASAAASATQALMQAPAVLHDCQLALTWKSTTEKISQRVGLLAA
jgi:hypothetical protein